LSSGVIIHDEEQTRPYLNFSQSIKAEATRELYKHCLGKYQKHYNIPSIDRLLAPSVPEIENQIIDYILELRKQDLSRGYINANFSALKHFYFMNDVRLNTVKIAKFMGEAGVKKHVDRAYTSSEIRTLLQNSELRMQVVIMTLATTGMRLAPITELTLAEVQKIPEYGIYKFTLYRNTKDQSTCFCSPECGQVISAYLQYRSRAGDRLESSEPFIREQFDVHDLEQVRKNAKAVSKKTISNILLSLVVKSGLRTVNHNYTCKERHPVAVAHGFRKWWMGEAVNAKMNPEIREMLLSHHIGLASAYYRPDESELLTEYMRCIDNGFFAISEEGKLRRKVQKLEVEKTAYEALAAKVASLEKEIRS
jgi:site-specific recombinase XerD